MTTLNGLDFGVLLPRASAAADVKVQACSGVRIHLKTRFLQVQARSIEAFVRDDFLPVARLTIDNADYLSAEETVARESEIAFDAVPAHREQVPIAICGGLETDTLFDSAHAVRGRVVRERWPLHGTMTIDTMQSGDSLCLHITITNESDVLDGADRATMLRTAFSGLSLNVSAERTTTAAGAK